MAPFMVSGASYVQVTDFVTDRSLFPYTQTNAIASSLSYTNTETQDYWVYMLFVNKCSAKKLVKIS